MVNKVVISSSMLCGSKPHLQQIDNLAHPSPFANADGEEQQASADGRAADDLAQQGGAAVERGDFGVPVRVGQRGEGLRCLPGCAARPTHAEVDHHICGSPGQPIVEAQQRPDRAQGRLHGPHLVAQDDVDVVEVSLQR
jgi:hypothetical protein